MLLMPNDLAGLVADNIVDAVQQFQNIENQQLLDRVSPWLDEVCQADRYAGSPDERFKNWLETSLLPSLRRLGESGQHAWDTIRDPTSAISKERIASVVLVLAVATGLQHLDISTLVAIVILAIRCKSAGS